jgi:hypothetical protein
MKTKRNELVRMCGRAAVGVFLCVGIAWGADTSPPTPGRPVILCHPMSQAVDLGSTNRGVTFEVTVEPAAPLLQASYVYAWQKSAAPGRAEWMPVGKESTNNTLTLANVGTNDVAFYRVTVRGGDVLVTSEPASLIVYWQGESVNVVGPPVFSPGSSGTCPGAYAGYVVYQKPADQGWGWKASATVPTGGYEVQDRGATKGLNSIEAVQFGGLPQCAGPQATKLRVLPNPVAGTAWRFAVYFPSAGPLPPAGPYQIYLKGWD